MSQGRLRWPSVSLTRIALIILTPLAVVTGMRIVAWAATPVKTWSAGETLTAADLNTNFNGLAAQMVDITSDQTIGGKKAFTGQMDIGFESLNFTINVATLPAGCALGSSTYVDCKCPAGKIAIAGGGYTTGAAFLQESRQINDGTCATGATDTCWRTTCVDTAGTRVKCTVANVVCARIKP